MSTLSVGMVLLFDLLVKENLNGSYVAYGINDSKYLNVFVEQDNDFPNTYVR